MPRGVCPPLYMEDGDLGAQQCADRAVSLETSQGHGIVQERKTMSTATATKTAKPIAEKKILAKMEENDCFNYLTKNVWEVEQSDILNWLDEISDESVQDKAQEFLVYRIEELRNEAIEDLKEESKSPKTKLQERIKMLQVDIERTQANLKDAQAELAAL